MAASCSLAFLPVISLTLKQFHHQRSFNFRRHSSKILCQNDPTMPTPHIENHDVTRRPTANFKPSVWGDYFISSSSLERPDAQTSNKIEQLKEEAKAMLSSAATDPSQQLILIDKIQRLGVEYLFESEIGSALQQIYDNIVHADGDLYTVALRFRLLRQAGHFVSPDVFREFKDDKGEFLDGLQHDLRGLLCLYEAAHLGFKEEHLLDDLIAFSTQHLRSLVSLQQNLYMASQVRRSLNLPLHKRMVRVEATYYISVYDNADGSENDLLLELAKLDYNALQLLHRTEMGQLSRWWKELNIISKLPFQPRDRLVEGYTVLMLCMHEPKYSAGRIYHAKLFTLFTIMDDIFDSYGSIAELQAIADDIRRWDVKDVPEFARALLAEIYNIFTEIDEDVAAKKLEDIVPYFQREVQRYVKSLMDEAKLSHSMTMPTLEEWLQIAAISIGVDYMIVGFTLSHWDLVTKEAMEWSTSGAKINNISSWSGRILDDIVTSKREQERGNVTSSITCYMKEHGVQEHEAKESLRKMVDEKWKEMNKEFMNSTAIPLRLRMIPVNLRRVPELFFEFGDGYTDSDGHVKEVIASLLVNPVPI